ncbi:MAG: hypothetical protein M9950_00315 [Thermomicrobiales bacterium]|nr:hypothetical protein [Thermomicrobiales bacterium]
MRRPAYLLSLLALVFLFVACGGEDTPTPAATVGPPTAESGQMMVADLVAMADAAWPNVESMRTTSRSSVITTAGDQPFNGSVQDWNRNGNRHIIEFQDGTAVNEQIYADGVIYMRGVFVSAAVAPGLNVNTWIIVDSVAIDPDSQIGVQVTYLTREQANPYGLLSDDLLQTPVHESGRVTVGARSCMLYTFGDEANTGNEIRYEIAIDSGGLPCQVVQRAGDAQNSTLYEFNSGITIEAPLDDATPEP